MFISAQEITVLLLDARNGRPFANHTISVQFHVEKVSDLQTLEDKTGTDGAAHFHLPQPISSSVTVSGFNEKLYPCSSLLPIDTAQVIREGMVSRCSKAVQGCRCKLGKQVSQLRVTSGQLILLARPFSWWERFLSHIWE